MLDNRSGYGAAGSTSNKSAAATKGKASKSHEKNCISHVVAFWVMTVLPVGTVAFMELGANAVIEELESPDNCHNTTSPLRAKAKLCPVDAVGKEDSHSQNSNQEG
jgi:hypothetical protein